MDCKLEAHKQNISDTYPIEIISDDEIHSPPSKEDQATNDSSFDPFSPMTPEQERNIKRRFNELKSAQDEATKEARAYMLDMYSLSEVSERSKFAERQKDMELLRSVLHRMRAAQSWRALTPQPKNYNDILDGLSKRYPHFHAVIETLRARMRLNALKKYPVVDFGANILLLGAPGCGKSSFLYELGESLDTRFSSISCASMSMAGDLTGLSVGWSTGHPGMIFDELVQQGCANPIILLDEVDKSQSEGSHLFVSALYTLLEKNNAREFKDEFVAVSIDASRINWFASANEISSLSAPIRDRFEVISVNPPSKDELRQILPQIYEQQVDNHGLQDVFSNKLPSEVIEKMLQSDLSIRRLKAQLESAMAHASIRADHSPAPLLLTPEDVPVDNQDQTNSRKIGFIH
ncbi:ATP-dependent Lon protease [Mariprofundus aestuarium]|uniref:ATP-dependent Lon protease n=1 Tax=Mariprofundus aestuarium TaxID=1921086 RepID=A0A2K8L3J9_MARES|nr:AAA family ATPase [Mariprofundus aestuarium]ATX79534.1 ATP-dependent Lon protease [Mariprofundus aestuarium]